MRLAAAKVLLSVIAVAALAACATSARHSTQTQRSERVSEWTFDISKLRAIDAVIESSISSNRLPGGVFWLECNQVIYAKAYGKRSLEPSEETMTEDTIFDAASLTKVLATTPAILLLAQRNEIELDAPVKTYLPSFVGENRERITVAHLLTHTSGLPAGIPASPGWAGYDVGIERATAQKANTEPGASFRYSDVNFILLGEIVRKVSGKSLDQFCQAEIYEPLGMRDTLFNPPGALLPRIAPTERQANGVLRGVVHDPTARRMGGVAGHAGLFTTAADVATFARMMLNGGAAKHRIFSVDTVRRMTATQTSGTVPARGYGWDIDSPYAGPRGAHFPIGSYGHTGWTGTSVWIDPGSQSFVILMANRNHPTEQGNVVPLRRTLGTLAAEAIGLGAMSAAR